MSAIREHLAEAYPDDELLCADGFDEAIIGVCTRFGQPPIVAYDRNKVLEILMAQGCTYLEAVEHFDFNIIGAWMGDATPCFVDLHRAEEPCTSTISSST